MTRQKIYFPERGDIIWLRFGEQAGHEQSGRRPALVLSPVEYNRKTGMAICCPFTSQVKGYPYEVLVPKGMKVSGVILVDQIKNIDWKMRRGEFAEKISDEILDEVSGKLMTLLNL